MHCEGNKTIVEERACTADLQNSVVDPTFIVDAHNDHHHLTTTHNIKETPTSTNLSSPKLYLAYHISSLLQLKKMEHTEKLFGVEFILTRKELLYCELTPWQNTFEELSTMDHNVIFF